MFSQLSHLSVHLTLLKETVCSLLRYVLTLKEEEVELRDGEWSEIPAPPRFRVRDEPRLRSAWRSRICFLEHVPLRFLDFERGKAKILFAGGALLCSSPGGERLGWSLRSSETGSRRSSWLRNWLQNRMESLLLGHWLSRCLHRWLHRWLYLRR